MLRGADRPAHLPFCHLEPRPLLRRHPSHHYLIRGHQLHDEPG
jgi:hypothetical protein